jgi:hypothetical protein
MKTYKGHLKVPRKTMHIDGYTIKFQYNSMYIHGVVTLILTKRNVRELIKYLEQIEQDMVYYGGYS